MGSCTRPGEVGHEQHRALEDADEQHLTAGVVDRDPGRQLGDLALDLLLGEQHVIDVGAVAVVGTQRPRRLRSGGGGLGHGAQGSSRGRTEGRAAGRVPRCTVSLPDARDHPRAAG